MRIVGLCRFSLVGRGDWKGTRGLTPAEFQAVAKDRARMLFDARRMEARLATFEQLTLASIKAQTEPDFTFVVLASSLMPEVYQDRLEALCARVPQVVLRYFPALPTVRAQELAFEELRIRFRGTLQFRLDDDDCVCADYIQALRTHVLPRLQNDDIFAASLPGVIFSVLHGPEAKVYNWPVKFFSAGTALHHPRRSIFRFGHYALPQRFPHMILPGGMALVTHDGTNDTDLPSEKRVRRRGMTGMTEAEVRKAKERFFPFLSEAGAELAGLARARVEAA